MTLLRIGPHLVLDLVLQLVLVVSLVVLVGELPSLPQQRSLVLMTNDSSGLHHLRQDTEGTSW